MKVFSNFIFFALFVLVLMNFRLSEAADLPALQCPKDLTQDSLEEWRDVAIEKTNTGNYNLVLDALRTCFSNGTPKCMDDLEYHVKNMKVANSFRYNDYGSYIAEREPVEGLTISSPKDLPPEFVLKSRAGGRDSEEVRIPPNLYELAKQKNWQALSYKTRSTGGFDSPANLTLVVIPGIDKDTYIQISPYPDYMGTKDDPKPHPRRGGVTDGQNTMTIITLDKKKSPPVGQLRKLEQNFMTGAYQWNNRLESGSCINCHTTPLRSISPLGYLVTNGSDKRMSPEDEATVKKINEMMVIEGVTWGKTKGTDREIRKGPPPESRPFGWSPPNSKTRTEEFIKKCAVDERTINYRGIGGSYQYTTKLENPDKVDWKKVEGAMSCTQCHNGEVRGPLHQRFSQEEITFKILVDRSMPPGADLTNDERIALLNCLKSEARNPEVNSSWIKRAEWMKKLECETIRPGTGPKPAVPLPTVGTPSVN